ncbi:DivIVA domain-containing protein [Nocardia transvalensis]|uniref:DivIVA domain-containing protein n=1 Tax=Nocardia transvalensis TaxID=37333 RepID=UPI0018932AA5|nr:DivIVA domain-containing protein [Nocardia transvalensis]MBF6332054.1 DivIVA domain-containing protein [Nocardia transvalensis]
MTSDDVRRIRFGKAPIGHRGYDTAEVDAFCARIADAFLGRGSLTAAEIRGHEFATAAFGHRGYDRDQVDDFLDRACVELEFARRGDRPHPTGEPLLTPEDVQRLRFSAPPHDHAGYAADEVDVFLDRVIATLAHIGPNGLTAEDVRTVNFGLAHAGSAAYHIEEVDSFLDVVVRTLEAEEVTRETTSPLIAHDGGASSGSASA